MGWFWSDSSATAQVSRPHPRGSSLAPPAGCPMHKSSGAPSLSSPPSSTATIPTTTGGCPVKHDTATTSSTSSPSSPFAAATSASQGCPVKNTSTSSSSSSSSDHSQSIFGRLNPLNYMPSLPQTRAANQSIALPTDREISSIPRGDVESNWEYPSPQQMYNAMIRKTPDDAPPPADAVEAMVAVHNFLNEGAWQEIEAWEARFSRGLGFGWRTCRSGEQGFEREYRQAKSEPGWQDGLPPRLARFMGRPGESTPKVRILQALGMVAPRLAGDPPFDRHDWYVQRRGQDGASTEVRYVIDYYSGPPEVTGEPVFYLDVRPALDGPTAAAERLLRWGGDVWYRASGASTREK